MLDQQVGAGEEGGLCKAGSGSSVGAQGTRHSAGTQVQSRPTERSGSRFGRVGGADSRGLPASCCGTAERLEAEKEHRSRPGPRGVTAAPAGTGAWVPVPTHARGASLHHHRLLHSPSAPLTRGTELGLQDEAQQGGSRDGRGDLRQMRGRMEENL